MRQINFAQAILEATDQCMQKDPNVILLGLGVPDPKGIFNTTSDLHKKYGTERVFDTPVSENGMTGICIGAAAAGLRPILTHQRLDFALLSLDQLANNAAKWHYMFGGQYQVPLVIRMIIGRGWGQGPQHSQSLQSIFGHIPGLKVVMPATVHDAKGLLVSAIEDNNPVLYLEHRWLHGVTGHVPTEVFREPLGKAKIVKEGKDVTIVAISYMVFEAFRAAEILEQNGISVEVVDLRSVQPLDRETILKSVAKTKRVLVADTGHLTYGTSAEIIATVSENLFETLEASPHRVASPDHPVPTSHALSKFYYPRSHDIARVVFEMLGKRDSTLSNKVIEELEIIENKTPADVPDTRFTGPF